jgi:drug/metabolite transporter superfamily protein YnfA
VDEDDEAERAARPWAAAFFLYVATAVAWLWIVAVVQLGRPDVAAAVGAGWVAAVTVAVVVLVRTRRRTNAR